LTNNELVRKARNEKEGLKHMRPSSFFVYSNKRLLIYNAKKICFKKCPYLSV
jgi:hypothetical protein